MANLEEKVINLISTHLGIPRQEVALESSLRKDLGAESLTIADLLIKVQEEFNVDLEDIDPEKVKTVSQLINIIANQNPEF